jgi:hypothetical protein
VVSACEEIIFLTQPIAISATSCDQRNELLEQVADNQKQPRLQFAGSGLQHPQVSCNQPQSAATKNSPFSADCSWKLRVPDRLQLLMTRRNYLVLVVSDRR